MTRWEIVHAYRRLFEQGKAEPWTCPLDGNPMVSQPDEDYEPVLWCYKCKARIAPGLAMYEKMEQAVKESNA